MSRRVRNRVTATVLGGFLLGAALLTTGTANAEQAAGGGRQVIFADGGVLGLSCRSSPSVESMIVPADGKVRLVNRTGHGARLRLNGESQGSIPDDGSTEVVFRQGTTAVTLDPSCAVPDQTTPVLVTAAPTPMPTTPLPSLPGPIPLPPDADVDSGPPPPPAATTDPSTPDEPADSGSAVPDPVVATRSATTTTGRPSSSRPRTSRTHSVAAQAATTAAQAVPQRGATSRGKTRTLSRTTGAVVPAFTGMPPGDDKTILPGVPTLDLPAPLTAAAPDFSAGAPSGIVAAMRPLPQTQSVGLLAVIAMVCVLGVTIGVIRAMVSERAYRSCAA